MREAIGVSSMCPLATLLVWEIIVEVVKCNGHSLYLFKFDAKVVATRRQCRVVRTVL